MKYIDADRLKAEIEKRMHICDGIFERDSDTYYQGKAVAYQETLSLIDSLPQEQPHWKPSEEQILVYEDAISCIPEFYKPKSTLKALLEQLKKLM